jgi:hypothetical protein
MSRARSPVHKWRTAPQPCCAGAPGQRRSEPRGGAFPSYRAWGYRPAECPALGDGGDDPQGCRKVNPSAPFIARPVATTLLTIGIALAGFFAFLRLPVAPLPPVDYPTIMVNANMPGASPATMAATVATPPRTPSRHHCRCRRDEFGEHGRHHPHHLAVQPNRSLNGAARDVQAAINQRALTCRRVSVRTPLTTRSTRPPRRSRSWR